ncbi:MAG: uracil-DNA glycosylase [Treponema sp.]|jgi:DNA polymerase|nr:uracil-DNA glycosylase [Treponema sp.]
MAPLEKGVLGKGLAIAETLRLNEHVNAEQKIKVARFLDLGIAALKSGYRNALYDYHFSDDPAPSSAAGKKTGCSAADIAAEIVSCSGCRLGKTRNRAVPGEGSEHPLVLVLGEGPGAEEDATGRPFVGPAGQLLDRMLASICLFREKNCFIANTVKCRPPGNRDPEFQEIRACAPFLIRQIEVLKPRLILAVGKVAANRLLHAGPGQNGDEESPPEPIGRLRGRFFDFAFPGSRGDSYPLSSAGDSGIRILATYHPSALLRDDSLKIPVFEDLKKLMLRLAALDEGYRQESRALMAKYAAKDPVFAAGAEEFLS